MDCTGRMGMLGLIAARLRALTHVELEVVDGEIDVQSRTVSVSVSVSNISISALSRGQARVGGGGG